MKARQEKEKEEREQKEEAERQERLRQHGTGVHVGSLDLKGAKLHHSHQMHHKRGVIWCWSCGSTVTAVARDLGGPCDLQATRGKQLGLNRLSRGDTPRKGMPWPLEEGVGPPEGRVVME